METLKELRDENFPSDNFKIREATRAIVFDNQGLTPLLFVSKHNYHKIPGGGIEEGEDKMQGLRRELLEETGCEIEVEKEIGQIIEYRSAINFNWHDNLKQTSYCYLGNITNKNNLPSFDKGEIAEGFKLVWFSLEDAIKTLENDKPDNYEGSFIQKRDLTFLKKAKEILEAN
ncbi:MAG: NUDIX domain-containing protein [Patescibacteria group bacterium]|nr:NUDIX domain-containing protein [Patescibacteria group bacterium]